MIPTTTTALILLAAFCNAPKERGADDDAQSRARLAPDPTIQAQIDTTVRAYMQVRDADSTGVERALREVRAVLKASRNDQVVVVRQLLYYQSRATDVPQSMLPLFIIRDAEISKTTIVMAVAPLLASEDGKIREAAIRLAQYVEDGDLHRDPDYSYYESYLEGCRIKSIEPEGALVERMYRVAPGVALLTFARVFPAESADVMKSIRWAEHVVDDVLWKGTRGFPEAAEMARPAAIEQLELLAKRDQWWARLYVAEIIREHDDLRTPELISRLEKDEHPLVRKLIAERGERRMPP